MSKTFDQEAFARAFKTVHESSIDTFFAAIDTHDLEVGKEEVLAKVGGMLEAPLQILLDIEDPNARAQQAAGIAAALMYDVYARLISGC